MKQEILYLEQIVTAQPSGQNLEYVSLSLRVGEILGVTGISESGASVLADVLCGKLCPASGTIYLDGVPVSYRSENEARKLGIYEITHQASVVNGMTAAENLAVLRGFSWKNLFLHRKNINEMSKQVFEHYGIDCVPHDRGSSITNEQRLEISICRALLCGAKVLVCREAGEGLDGDELIRFAAFLHQLRDEGVSVIVFNSSVFKVLQYADRIAVMRGGMICWERPRKDMTAYGIHQRLRISSTGMSPKERTVPRLYLSLQEISLIDNDIAPFSVDLYTGRAAGVLCGGLNGRGIIYRMFSGQGQTEGIAMQDGRMYHLADWRRRHADEICCMGPRFWEKGVFENLTAAENIVFRSMNRFRERGDVINRRMLRLALRDFAAEMGFDPDGLDVYPRHLSSRMRDKLVLLRVMFAPVGLLVLDYPFYTIDEQIKAELLHCIAVLRARGTAVLWSSNDRSVLQDNCESVTVCE